MLLAEGEPMLHRFDRTNQEKTRQRYLEHYLWDLVLQIADQSSVRLATSFSVTTSTKSITLISIKPPYLINGPNNKECNSICQYGIAVSSYYNLGFAKFTQVISKYKKIINHSDSIVV